MTYEADEAAAAEGLKQGAIAALTIFRDELIHDRDRIENLSEPIFPVILDLLDRCIEEARKA